MTSFNYTFRREITQSDSPPGILFRYLASRLHPSYTHWELLLIACRAFWLPFAQQHLTQTADAELRQTALDSIYQLEQHIQYLRSSFGLEAVVPPTVTVSHTVVPDAAVAALPASPGTGWEAVPTPDPDDDPFS